MIPPGSGRFELECSQDVPAKSSLILLACRSKQDGLQARGSVTTERRAQCLKPWDGLRLKSKRLQEPELELSFGALFRGEIKRLAISFPV